jgi:hypothetical protein
MTPCNALLRITGLQQNTCRQPSCAYMQFAVIYTSFAVMGYKALHGITYRLSCVNIAVSAAVVTCS